MGIWIFILGFIGAIIGLVLLIWLCAYIFALNFIPTWLRHLPVRILAPLVCWVCGVDLEIIGKENLPETKGKRGYGVVANHSSMFDAIVIAAVIKDPIAFIAKKEISTWPFVGRWARTIGCPFIDRKNLRQSYSAVMVDGANNIKKGMAMMIFPAGTRSLSNKVFDFKPGSFKMATSVDAPILPISLIDVHKSAKSSFFKRITVKVYVHPWIESETYKEMSSFELAKSTQSLIEKPINDFENKE